jgi:hypothetical protein
MQIRVLCPGCRKKLALPGHLAGKTLRCPGCQTAFRAPATGAAASPPPPDAGGNPFEFAGGGAPAAEGAAFDFAGGGGAPPEGGVGQPAPGQVHGLGWRLVRSGVGLAYLGLRVGFVAVLLFLVAGGVLGLGVWLLTSSGQANAGVYACWAVAGVFAVVGVILVVIGSIMSGIGQLLCCAVPQGMPARLCIWGSVALPLAGLVFGGVSAALTPKPEITTTTLTNAKDEERPPAPAGDAGTGVPTAVAKVEPDGTVKASSPEEWAKVLQPAVPYLVAFSVVLAVLGGTSLFSEVLWLLFLRQVAWLLGNQRLARGAGRFVVYLFVWPLLMSCAVGSLGLVVWLANLGGSTAMPWMVGVPGALIGLLFLVNWLWYFFVLRSTALTLRRGVASA